MGQPLPCAMPHLRPPASRHLPLTLPWPPLPPCLPACLQRRFPKGLKVHVHSLDRFGCLAALARVLNTAGLSVTRAKVRTYATSKSSGHTFYVMDARGGPPDKCVCEETGGQGLGPGRAQGNPPGSMGAHAATGRVLIRSPAPPARPTTRRARVEAACREIGGQLVEAGQEARSSSVGSHRFSFSFLQRNWGRAWGECRRLSAGVRGETAGPGAAHAALARQRT